jgi:hypothetical protein
MQLQCPPLRRSGRRRDASWPILSADRQRCGGHHRMDQHYKLSQPIASLGDFKHDAFSFWVRDLLDKRARLLCTQQPEQL